VNDEITVLDLFSGIGGFSLGLEAAGPFRTVAFCEQDKFCQAVLKKHWPNVPIFNDVRTIPTDGLGKIDIVCGGFPCQPFSTASAGKRQGTRDDRYLWPQMLRVIQETRCRWVVGENVVGIDGVALEQVVLDLEASGYTVAPPLEIPACAIGHNHRRSRLWFLAHTNGDGKSHGTVNAEAPKLSRNYCDAGNLGERNGVPNRVDRLKALGNAVVPQVVAQIGRAILAAEDAG
jgi:DNA (cytosine-5)-methyltransferase 1|tara:strand:+ start:336 stop:1031 length:696 start_codon:yes stop_codon:yes gene_type:complete